MNMSVQSVQSMQSVRQSVHRPDKDVVLLPSGYVVEKRDVTKMFR